MDVMTKVAEILSDFGRRHEQKLKDNLSSTGANNTGTLRDSIKFNVQILGESASIKIDMADYGEFVHRGREAGSFPPVDEIRQWVIDRGLTMDRNEIGQNLSLEQEQNSLTYLIGRKIEREGIQERPFIEDLPSDEIKRELIDTLGKELKEDIINSLNIN